MNRRNSRDATAAGFPAGSRLSRRDFLELAGMTTATLALAGDSLADALRPVDASSAPGSRLADTHDLVSLPLWGPYSKKHFGISHIPDPGRGLSFDLSLFPFSPAAPHLLPSVTSRRSGVHPWEVSPNLDYYAFRLETLWKDRLYCDLSFCGRDTRSRLIRMELVNRTPVPQEMVLNCLAQLCFPPLRELTAEPIRLDAVELPSGALWTSALDYVDLQFAKPRPTDNLVPDGKWRGEERRHNTVGGSVVAQGFGLDAGDRLHYRIRLDHSYANAQLIWRYSLDQGERVTFRVEGVREGQVLFQGNGEFATVAVPLGPLPSGVSEFHFISSGGAAVALNGFVVIEAARADELRFVPRPWRPAPAITIAGWNNAPILKYEDVREAYGFALDAAWAGHRQVQWRDLDRTLGCDSGPETRARIFGTRSHPGDPGSLFIHAWTGPLTVAANSTRVVSGLVCTGAEQEVRRSLDSFGSHAKKNQRMFAMAKRSSFRPISVPDKPGDDTGQRLMAAVTLTNLVYPLYTQGSYIRNYSPGKIWDCLYTWDAGFIGLGLLELDPRGAVDALNAYTTPPGAQSAFIHHGTPLPVQIYLFYELWNRTQSRPFLAYFYPRLRQYHLFLAGKLGSATTRQHQDHLICTWDYFYNTGGWDDYPPQKFVHQQKMTASVAPAINSCHTIRCAKMLRRMAEALGRPEDIAEYDSDVAVLSSSLQKYSWDEASGYYGYVLHDAAGRPTGILRTEAGVNFNMGLDGVCPLIAGICSAQQAERILDHLFSPQRLWTEVGITTVDQTAPYYNPDGYWNGSVWFAHQWFLWKTMLDLGRGDLAVRIARTGLAVWRKVTGASYDCMEHFVPRPPFGEGWVQFSSLSSPALSWFAALSTPLRLTCGFDAWIEECHCDPIHRRLSAGLRCAANQASPRFSVLACMTPNAQFRVLWNGADAEFRHEGDGLLQIQLPRDAGVGELLVSAI